VVCPAVQASALACLERGLIHSRLLGISGSRCLGSSCETEADITTVININQPKTALEFLEKIWGRHILFQSHKRIPVVLSVNN